MAGGALPIFVTALRDHYDNSDALWGELDALLRALLPAVEDRKGDQSRPKVDDTEPVSGARLVGIATRSRWHRCINTRERIERTLDAGDYDRASHKMTSLHNRLW